MTLPRMLRGALVGAVVACVALSACTNDDPAPDPTTTSAAATEEPTADATTEPAEILPPEKPTLMDSNDAIGARAAAEYFLSLHGYVLQTGDLTEWDVLCDPESVFCESVRKRVQEDSQLGYVYRGGDVAVVIESVVEPSATVEFFEVAGLLTQAPSETQDRSGAVVAVREEPTTASFSVFLNMDSSGKWIVRAVDTGEPQ